MANTTAPESWVWIDVALPHGDPSFAGMAPKWVRNGLLNKRASHKQRWLATLWIRRNANA